jgi:hypothetical protein
MRSLITILLARVVAACCHSRTTDARLTEREAVHIAQLDGRATRCELGGFDRPSGRYTSFLGATVWRVHFEGKVSAPDSYFSVHVADWTEATELLGGL